MLADGDAAAGLATIVGVRRQRNDPVLFVDSGDVTVDPGDVVVVELYRNAPSAPPSATGEAGAISPSRAGEEAVPPVFLATVVIGSGQLVADAVGIETVARVVRLATEVEVRELARSGAEAASAARVSAAGMPEGWDAWLQPKGEEPAVTSREPSHDMPTAGDFVRRLFPNPEPPRRPRGTGPGTDG